MAGGGNEGHSSVNRAPFQTLNKSKNKESSCTTRKHALIDSGKENYCPGDCEPPKKRG